MDLWNSRHLEPPPSSSCKLRNNTINLEALHTLCKKTETLFLKQFFLSQECKLLHRLVRRHKLKYRKMMQYKSTQKLNRCMRIYEEFHYANLVGNFMNSLPECYERDSTYFPSRNLLDYFLVRTQGFAKLMVRALECAKQGINGWYNQIFMGHNMGTSIVMVGLQSRILIILRYLLKELCQFYDELVQLRGKFANVQYEWLPVGYNFPEKLLTWLDVYWAFNEREREIAPNVNRPALFTDLTINDLFEDDDVQFCKQYTIVDDEGDLEIVKEYMNILNSEDETGVRAIPEVKDAIEVVNEEAKSLLVKLEQPSQFVENLNLNEDIGEPIELNAKMSEITSKMKDIKDVRSAERFVRRSKQYFRSVGMGQQKYFDLLHFVEIQKIQCWGGKPQLINSAVRLIKEKIIAIISEEEC